jgi:hypothetical protein
MLVLLYTIDNQVEFFECRFVDKVTYLETYVAPWAVLLIADIVLIIRSKLLVKYTLILQPDPRVRAKLAERRGSQLRLCCILVGLLFGVNLMAVGARLTGSEVAWVAFNLLHSAQGLAVALAVTCDRRVLSVYTRPGRKRRSKLLADTSSMEQLLWQPMPQTV